MRHGFAFLVWMLAVAAAGGHALAVPPPSQHAGRKADRLDAASRLAPPDAPPPGPIRKQHFASDVCRVISQEARRQGLPEEFFARLIWRESLFDPRAVSPKGAEGIAQFMPATARQRGLADPFVPHLALAASAQFLGDLRLQHGNLGLAAAAYNAGSGAVTAWQQGQGGLPYETRDYVQFITGRPAEEWAKSSDSHATPRLGKEADFITACAKLVKRQLNPAPPARRERWRPWGVILARGFVESWVLKSFAQLRGRYPSVLADREPLVVRKTNPSMGRRKMATAMVGAETRAEAEDICGKLRKLGAVCIISRNENEAREANGL